MLVIGLYSHDLPLFYISSPDAEDRIITSLEALLYATVPDIRAEISFLSHRYIALLMRSNGYALALVTNENHIVGFYKEILPELRAALVPYEGQDPGFISRQYGLPLIESLECVYSYIPRRLMRGKERYYKRAVADLGHTSFGIAFEEYSIIFNRKGIFIGPMRHGSEIEDEVSDSVLALAKEFGKNPKGLILQTGSRSTAVITL